MLDFYLVGVTPGSEAAFIAAANKNASILSAIPNGPLGTASDVVDLSGLLGPNGELPVVPNLKAQVGNNTYLYVNDDFVNPALACGDNSIPHGVGVDYRASYGLSGTGQQMNVFPVNGTSIVPNDIAAANAIAIEDLSFNQTGRAVVNFSQQGAYEDANHNPLPTAIYLANENNFLSGLAGQLNSLPDGVLRQTVFVVSAGNGVGDTGTSGLDLSTELQALHNQFPRVFGALDGGPHMVVVGGQNDSLGFGFDTGFNYSGTANDANGNPLMVYAPGRNVAVNGTGCTADGTSFAAPAVSSLLAQLLAANPNLTLAQVTQMLMQSAKNNAAANWLPRFATVQQAISNQYYCTLSIQTGGGSGSGTVTANPASPFYTNGTIVTLTASPGTLSTFAGWSGAASGTALSVNITMNGSQSVGATFNLASISLQGDGGSDGVDLGNASACGISSDLFLDGTISIQLSNDGSGDPTTATVSADCDDSLGDYLSYSWQGNMTWNGSAFTGSLARTSNANDPAVTLTVTLGTDGQYTASATLPFTYYVYITDGSCTGPLNTFNYSVSGVPMSP
jgi:hypothetical protein